jgi:hypothetical protein
MKRLIRLLSGYQGVWAWRSRKNTLTLITLLTLLVMLTSSAQGAAPRQGPDAPNPPIVMPTWVKDYVDAPPFFFFMSDRSLHFKPITNQPCIAYGGDHLWYSCYNFTTQLWQTKLVDASLMVGAYAALTFNKNGKPFISYYDAKDGELWLAYDLGPNEFTDIWTTVRVDFNVLRAENPQPDVAGQDVANAAADMRAFQDLLLNPSPGVDAANFIPVAKGVGLFTSIAIDSLGQLHISYYDADNGALKYAFWNGFDPWHIDVVDDSATNPGKVGLGTSIATYTDVDMKVTVHVSYMSEKYDDLKYAQKNALGQWKRETVDGNNGAHDNVGPYSSIAVDKNGFPHISYRDFALQNLKYAKMKADKSWYITKIDSAGDVGYFTSIAVNSSKVVFISYYDNTNGDLKFAKGSDDTWTVKALKTGGDIGYFTSIALDPNGYPAISYFHASEGTLENIYQDVKGWHVRPDVAGPAFDVGQATSLVLNSVGAPSISYMNASVLDLKMARASGSNWLLETVPTGVSAGAFSSIKLLNDHTPVIAYYDMDNGDLIYGVRNVAWWDLYNVDPDYKDNDVGQFVSLAIDSLGIPHMSYFDATFGNLKYASWNPLTLEWDIEIAGSPGDVGMFTSLALDSNDLPYISYYDATNERVRMAFKTIIGAWVRETVDYVGDPSDDKPVLEAYTSIAVDNLDFPHISYYNATLRNLWLASWNGATFDYELVDSTGEVGFWNSLAISPLDNSRHICYYDKTNGDLRYAFSVFNGVSWDWYYQLVDGGPLDDNTDVGQFCSIGFLNGLNVDGSYRVGISYYSASLGDLKFAHTYPNPLVAVWWNFAPLILRLP